MTAASGRRAKALLLAGGLGTRLRPITDATPKCLVEIEGRPLMEYWFSALEEAGIRDILVNTHHLPEQVRRFIARKNHQGFHALESFEPRLLGSAGTIAANADWGNGANEIVIAYADNLSDVHIGALLAAHRGHGDPVTMMLFRAPNPSACGIAELDQLGRVIEFEEKPAEPKSDLANAGVYVVDGAAWREIAEMRAFDLGYDVLPRFVGRMRGYVHRGYHQDIGNHEALRAARAVAADIFGPNGEAEMEGMQ